MLHASAPINRSRSCAYTMPMTAGNSDTSSATMIACTAVTAASSCLPSPTRRAITAVTAIASPIATEYSRNR